MDLVEMDPPYGIDLDDLRTDKSAMLNYTEIEKKEFLEFISRAIFLSHRALRNGGWLVMWFGPDPWYSILPQLIESFGFVVKYIPALWVKPKGQTRQPRTTMANSYEMFLYARKGEAILQKQGRVNTYIYSGVSADRRIHPTERPIEMIEDVLSTFVPAGSNVLFTFLGSGNTLLAAHNRGMSAFGYDLSEEYKNAFILRVNEGTPGNYKSYSDPKAKKQ